MFAAVPLALPSARYDEIHYASSSGNMETVDLLRRWTEDPSSPFKGPITRMMLLEGRNDCDDLLVLPISGEDPGTIEARWARAGATARMNEGGSRQWRLSLPALSFRRDGQDWLAHVDDRFAFLRAIPTACAHTELPATSKAPAQSARTSDIVAAVLASHARSKNKGALRALTIAFGDHRNVRDPAEIPVTGSSRAVYRDSRGRQQLVATWLWPECTSASTSAKAILSGMPGGWRVKTNARPAGSLCQLSVAQDWQDMK